MNFAKFLPKLTAFSLVLWLTACQAPTEQTTFNRSEAVKARINLALAYLEQSDFPKAKENIDKALEHDNKDYLPHSVLAYYYQQIGDYSKAEHTYQQAIELSKPHSKNAQARPDVLNNYGTFLCKQKQFDKAYQQFDTALTSQESYYNQADTLENVALCANMAKDLAKQNKAVDDLAKLDQSRAEKLRQLFK
ncbi:MULTISPECIES: type IV pilus biogenesis/stability protein PilW [Glaesserella]|uniref:Type IV pilus biogenesis/stability protein PilW n=1 Tax=Glaesserella australis TaxID=2094024 RepID=A0A328C2S7_9PAST|nr:MULTISPECIES: type IV pilus biogenesis/stability protein PilW [Glaesserella]AUI66426.1 type IV pilus biogenesis/stability protein PilW [Glaesserella sp. 15-184]RAL19360.1 type IV pilus biogenesis/stability protein PilW [Glaesserella australis]